MQRGLAITFVSLIAFALLAVGAADAKQFKPNQRVRVVKTLASAETAGAIATATVSCPQTTRPDLRPWRAVSGGFDMMGQPRVHSVRDPLSRRSAAGSSSSR